MLTPPLFHDRLDSGRVLARKLNTVDLGRFPVVLALPRGGVPVGFEVARALHAELDVFLVRKLGVPGHEELAMGAIASGGVQVLNEPLIRQLGVSPAAIEAVIERERHQLVRRERIYREGRPAIPVEGRPTILVDDGLATGATMLAAARALRNQNPKRITIAAPVGSPDTWRELRAHADEVICAFTPEPFYAVGIWYEDFSQTSDEEVREWLEIATHQPIG